MSNRKNGGRYFQTVGELFSNLPPVTSNVIEVFDLGIKNYLSALVYFEKKINGNTETFIANLERYPVGWRFNDIQDEQGRAVVIQLSPRR